MADGRDSDTEFQPAHEEVLVCPCGVPIMPPEKSQQRWYSPTVHPRRPDLKVRALMRYGDDPQRLWFERSEDNPNVWVMHGSAVRGDRPGVVFQWGNELATCGCGVEHVLVAIEPLPAPDRPMGAAAL